MKMVGLVDSYEEALIYAEKYNVDILEKKPIELILAINEYLTLEAITLPQPAEISGEELKEKLELGDVIILQDEDGNQNPYRLLDRFQVEENSYVSLVRTDQEKNSEYDVYFYRWVPGNLQLFALKEDEWFKVEKSYRLQREQHEETELEDDLDTESREQLALA
ncbi:DUF1292 domain-containing protein [Paenibacillus sp. VTT E-133291]|uniref:DUF1292 domain-containing protein n=1 Tax=Paenibacillus sp. VTT E-133291 TaxID=1986223 RepID=UPI000B9FB807|nr:DUF1292 domain-containing protein [Paenibacillus sp. VTT E-133291]OZQ97432.1 hypothetical protein CA598_06450 [Paenibacillus sp. VTT E-133291]